MDINEKAERIKKWQNCNFVHPLTCGNCGKNLEPKINREFGGERLYLFCPNCKLGQDHIPEVVYLVNFEEVEELYKKLGAKY